MKIYEAFPHVKRVEKAEVGIEIEMEGHNLGLDPKYPNYIGEGGVVKNWKLTHDGSLRGESCEYVLAKPVARKDVKKSLADLDEWLKDRGAHRQPSDRCGVHVHVNVQDLTVEQTINFILLYLVFEDLLVRYCGEDREGNLFCLRARDAEAMLDAIFAAKQTNSLVAMQQDAFRYASINVTSLTKYGTLEFRALPTVADVMRIKEWVDILLAVKDYSLTVGESKELVETLSLNGEVRFFKDVFKDMAPVLAHRGLQRQVREGVRRIQHIAYVQPAKKKVKYEDFNEEEKALIDAGKKMLKESYGMDHGNVYLPGDRYQVIIPSLRQLQAGHGYAVIDLNAPLPGREDEEVFNRGLGRNVNRARPPIAHDEDDDGPDEDDGFMEGPAELQPVPDEPVPFLDRAAAAQLQQGGIRWGERPRAPDPWQPAVRAGRPRQRPAQPVHDIAAIFNGGLGDVLE